MVLLFALFVWGGVAPYSHLSDFNFAAGHVFSHLSTFIVASEPTVKYSFQHRLVFFTTGFSALFYFHVQLLKFNAM